MEWINRVLDAPPLSVALLVCVVLALGVFNLVRSLKGKPDDSKSLAVALAAVTERITALEHDMERLEKLEQGLDAKVDGLTINWIECKTVLKELKDHINHEFDRLIYGPEENRE